MPMHIITWVPALLIICFFTFVIGLMAITKKVLKRGRRNPLTKDLLRSPGETLREQEADLNFDLIAHSLSLVLSLFLFFST